LSMSGLREVGTVIFLTFNRRQSSDKSVGQNRGVWKLLNLFKPFQEKICLFLRHSLRHQLVWPCPLLNHSGYRTPGIETAFKQNGNHSFEMPNA
jgi:hypothetical protein